MRVPRGVRQRFFASEDETHPRYAFQAFARGRNQRVERHLLRIHRQRAERTHGIDDQAFAVLRNDLGDFR